MGNGITVRPAKASDATRIYEINRDSLGYDFPPEKTQQRLELILSRGTDRIFVACACGHVIGYIHGSGYDCVYFDSLKNILAIAVDREFQNKGTGRMLLSALEDWARQEGSAGVRLVSGFNRQEAHRFYLRCGYTHRKDQKNFIKYFKPNK